MTNNISEVAKTSRENYCCICEEEEKLSVAWGGQLQVMFIFYCPIDLCNSLIQQTHQMPSRLAQQRDSTLYLIHFSRHTVCILVTTFSIVYNIW